MSWNVYFISMPNEFSDCRHEIEVGDLVKPQVIARWSVSRTDKFPCGSYPGRARLGKAGAPARCGYAVSIYRCGVRVLDLGCENAVQGLKSVSGLKSKRDG